MPDHRREPRRHRVQRFFERDAQRRRPAEAVAAVVGRRPGRHARALADRDRRVVDQGRRREAVFERGQIDERLDRRAGLPLGLGGAVELAQFEAEAAAHRQHAAGMRVDRDQRARDLRDLAQGCRAARGAAWRRVALGAWPAASRQRLDQHEIARLDDIGRRCAASGRACRRRAAAAPSASRQTGCARSRRPSARSPRRPPRCAAPPPAASRPSRRRPAPLRRRAGAAQFGPGSIWPTAPRQPPCLRS